MAAFILSVGLTALAGLSVHFSSQSRMAWERTGTSVVRHNMQEWMGARPFEDITSGAGVIDTHYATWTVTDESSEVKSIHVTAQMMIPISEGNGKGKGKGNSGPTYDTTHVGGTWGFQADTFTVRRFRR